MKINRKKLINKIINTLYPSDELEYRAAELRTALETCSDTGIRTTADLVECIFETLADLDIFITEAVCDECEYCKVIEEPDIGYSYTTCNGPESLGCRNPEIDAKYTNGTIRKLTGDYVYELITKIY